MSNPSRNIKINRDCIVRFKKITDDLHLRSAAWAGLFVQYELEFLRKNLFYLPKNSVLGCKFLTHKYKESSNLENYSIRMEQELVDRLKFWCERHNLSKQMFIEYALTSACERIGNTSDSLKERNLKGNVLMPMYFLELAFKERISVNKRIEYFKEKLLIQDFMIPDDFKKKVNVKVDGRKRKRK